jgi:hypothetical protein
MANSRLPVPAPAKSLLGYGLFSVAENRSDPAELRGHWKSGVEWQNVCPDGDTTYDECVQANSLGVNVDTIDEPDPKAATAVRTQWGATPFTVFVEVDCSPPGFWDNADEIVDRTFGESEAFEVESVFLTGTVGTVPNLAFPHLAAASALSDGDTVLQLVTANVGPTGTGSDDIVEAFGDLEQALSACVKGKGVIHLPAELLAHAVANHLITERDGILYSPVGHKIAVSAAYTGIAPDGTSVAGVKWVYATGPVFMYRSRGAKLGNKTDTLDRSVNTLKRIFERTYVIGYDCCLFGVPVSTGGVVTGSSDSAQ